MKSFKQYLTEAKIDRANGSVVSEFYPNTSVSFMINGIEHEGKNVVYVENAKTIRYAPQYMSKSSFDDLGEAKEEAEQIKELINRELKKQLDLFDKNMESFYKKIGLVKVG